MSLKTKPFNLVADYCRVHYDIMLGNAIMNMFFLNTFINVFHILTLSHCGGEYVFSLPHTCFASKIGSLINLNKKEKKIQIYIKLLMYVN